jgi:DHA1 family multidrug resistance protein-like MFS transporter
MRNSRTALIAIALVAGLAELGYAVMNVSAMPVYLHESMGYGASSVAAIGTAFLLCEGLLKGPFGVLGDHVGRKWLIIAGPLVSAVTALLTLVIQPTQWYLFVLLRLLDGFGAAALWPSALVMMADVIEENRRSQAMSLFNVTYLVGIALGPFIGGAANDISAQVLPGVDKYRASFYVISVLFMLTAVVAWWRIPNIPPHPHEPTELESGFSFGALIKSLRQVPEALVMSFVTFFGIGLVMLIVKLFALHEFALSETQFGALLLAPCLVIALASVPLGTIGDTIGPARAVRWGLGVCAFSMCGVVVVHGEMPFVVKAAGMVIGGSLIGVGFVIAFPSWMAYVSRSCAPRQRGAVMGAVGTAQGLGAMMGAPLGGYLYEHMHLRIPFMPWINSHYAPFIGCALLLLTAWVLALTTIKENAPPCSLPGSC